MSDKIEGLSRQQIESSLPAEIYDARFVPALFAPFAQKVVTHAQVGSEQRVLDVACGTGALTSAVVSLVGPLGTVVGLDPNPEMLEVARRRSAAVTWRQGRAEALPFEDDSFDRVVSQFGLMFFDDPSLGLAEMRRVVRPGGRLTVAVWDAIHASPGYSVLAEILQDLFGSEIADAFRAPFRLGNVEALMAVARQAGLPSATVVRERGKASFGTIRDLVATERACVWTLGGFLDDEQFGRLLSAAERSLSPFLRSDGRIEFDVGALILVSHPNEG